VVPLSADAQQGPAVVEKPAAAVAAVNGIVFGSQLLWIGAYWAACGKQRLLPAKSQIRITVDGSTHLSCLF